MYAATTRDKKMGRYTGPQSTRLANFRHLPPLKAFVQALWINLTYGDQNPWMLSAPSQAPMQI